MGGEWTETTLGEVIISHDAKRRPVKEADRKPGPYPYYGASGIVDYVDSYLFEGEYLLVAEDGENLRTRQTPIARLASGKFWVNNHAHIVQASAQSTTRFLHYALSNIEIAPFLSGAVMPKLTQGNLHRIPIMLPPKREQDRIAAILGALDDKIAVNRRMGATLEAMARALFKSWFVDFDPVRARAAGRDPGLPPALATLFPDRFETGEGVDVPAGWTVRTIGELAEVVGGSTPSTSNAAFWVGGARGWATPKDLSNLAGPILRQTAKRVTEAGLAQIGSGLLPVGTVLLSSRAPIGYLAVAELPVAINQGFIAMKAKPGVSNLFLLLWAREAKDLLLDAVDHLRRVHRGEKRRGPVPTAFVPKAWGRQLKTDDGTFDLTGYRLCTLDRLRRAIRRRDVFPVRSLRYADPRKGLLTGTAWEAARPMVCRTVGVAVAGDEEIAKLSARLDLAYRQSAARVPDNDAVTITRTASGADLSIEPLDKIYEPLSLTDLHKAIDARLPQLDLPELILEMHARTGFGAAFTHASEGNARAGDIATTICAVLVAEATNTALLQKTH